MNETSALATFIITSIILGYLSGSVLWSVFIGKHFYQKDLRDFGSKNAGATNSMRIYGKKVAILVLFLDILKCLIPTIVMWVIARYTLAPYLVVSDEFNPYTIAYLTSLFAVIGHCFPVFYKFKGGKGAACLGAFLLCVSPFAGLLALTTMILVVIFTKYVSLASIIASITSVILLFVPGVNWMYMLNINITNLLLIDGFGINWVLFSALLVFVGVVLLLYQHRSNIKRLLKGEETKLGSKSAKVDTNVNTISEK